MKNSRTLTLAFVVLGAGIAAVASTSASAESKTPAAKTAETKVAGSSGGTIPALHLEPVPNEPGPRPKKDDWKKAKSVSARRPLPAGCDLQLLEGWLKVRCRKRTTAAITLLAGPKDGVLMWTDPPKLSKGEEPQLESVRYAEVIFPLRRGETRMLQWYKWAEGGYNSFTSPTFDFSLSEQWIDTPGPVIVSSGPRVRVEG